jgi:hypothetical protein
MPTLRPFPGAVVRALPLSISLLLNLAMLRPLLILSVVTNLTLSVVTTFAARVTVRDDLTLLASEAKKKILEVVAEPGWGEKTRSSNYAAGAAVLNTLVVDLVDKQRARDVQECMGTAQLEKTHRTTSGSNANSGGNDTSTGGDAHDGDADGSNGKSKNNGLRTMYDACTMAASWGTDSARRIPKTGRTAPTC